MAEALTNLVRGMAEIETTYATTPTWAPADDGFLMYDNAEPVTLDTAVVDIQPLTGVFTKRANLIGRQLWNFNPTIYCQGGTAAGVAPRFNDLLRACALQETVVASTSVTYAPRSSGFESCSVAVDYNGIYRVAAGVFGTFTMSGSAGQGIQIQFSMQGRYNAPSISLPSWSGFAAGANLASTMKSSNLTILANATTWDSTSPEPLLFKSFNFDRGGQIGERTDANSPDALYGLSYVDSNPTLEIVVEAKQTFNASEIPNWWGDMANSVFHDISFQYGSGAGKVFDFNFPFGQLTQVQESSGENGIRNWVLSYRIQSSGTDNEFNIAIT